MTTLGLGFSRRHLNEEFPTLPLLKNMYIQATPFVYESLKPGQIRLVHVMPSSDLRVECELRHVDFDSLQSWTALSYVWGDGPAEHRIFLNGSSFSVHANLLGALKALDRCRHQIQEKTWIWIDALCLNQDDTVEKSEQLPYMDRIYSNATIVTIWLGDDKVCPRMIVEAFRHLWNMDSLARGCDGEEAQRLLYDCLRSSAVLDRCFGITHQQLVAFRKLYDHMSAACNREFAKLESTLAKPAWAKFAFKYDLFPPDHHFWGALLAFTNNPWHTRVWTLQEVRLAKSKALLSPQGLIPWDYIYNYLLVLVFPGGRFNYMSPAHMDEMKHWMHTADDFYSIIQQQIYTSLEFPESLAWLLSESHNRKATLAKDHVYGLLGLMKDEVKSSFKIDYSESDAKVFSSAFKLALGPMYGDSYWLARLWRTCNSDMPRVEDNWPSWCPDFGDVGIPGYSSPVPYPGEVDDNTVETWRRLGKVDTRQGQDVLGFSAWHLDTVKRCAPKAMGTSYQRVHRDWDLLPDSAGLLQDLFDICFDVEQREWMRDLKRVFPEPGRFIASRVVEFIYGSCVHENYDPGLIAVEMALMMLLAVDIKDIHNISGVESVLGISRQGVAFFLPILLAIASILNRRFIFETESGKFGFAWRPLSSGDMVVYVPGGHCQFIVSANGRTFLGACYVEGYAGDSLTSILTQEGNDWRMFYVY